MASSNRTDRDLNINLLAKDSTRQGTAAAAANFNKLGESVKKTNDQAGKLGPTTKKTAADMDKLATASMALGLGLVAAFGSALAVTAKFDKQMSEVGAVAGASAQEFDKLRKAAIGAGASTSFSATEAAQAEAELAKAGISTADILGGALSGSLSLAAAGSLNLADAATISAAAMNTFGLKGKDVSHIADVFAAAANKSAAGVQDLGLGLQQVGTVASAAGLSLEETVGILAAFADRGLKGQDAGTSLKTAIQKLVAPTKEAKGVMDDLGIAVYDQGGKVKDAAGLASELQHAMAALSDEQRNAAMNTIFGTDAIRAATILTRLGKNGVDEYVKAVNDQGAAADVARKKLDNLAGDVEYLRGNLESLALGSTQASTGGLRLLVQSGDALVQNISSLPGWLQQGVVGLGLLAGAALLAWGAQTKLRLKLDEATAAMVRQGSISQATAGKLGMFAGAASKAGLVLAALQVGGAVLSSVFDKKLNPSVSVLAAEMGDFAKTGKLGTETMATLINGTLNFDDTLREMSATGLRKAGRDVENFIGNLVGMRSTQDKVAESTTALDQALAQMVRGGQQAEADKFFAMLLKRAQDLGLNIDVLKAKFPEYKAAQADAGTQSGILAGQIGDVNDALSTQEQNLKDVNTQWDILHGKQLAETDALLAAAVAADSVKEVFAEGGKSIQGHSTAALENKKALEDAAQAAKDAALAMADRTGDWGAAMALMDEMKAKTVANTGAVGKEREAIQGLADDLFKLPKTTDLQVKINVNTAGLTKLGGSLLALHGFEGSGDNDFGGFQATAPMFTADGPGIPYAAGSPGGTFLVDAGVPSVSVYLDSRLLTDYVDVRVGELDRKITRAKYVPGRD